MESIKSSTQVLDTIILGFVLILVHEFIVTDNDIWKFILCIFHTLFVEMRMLSTAFFFFLFTVLFILLYFHFCFLNSICYLTHPRITHFCFWYGCLLYLFIFSKFIQHFVFLISAILENHKSHSYAHRTLVNVSYILMVIANPA